MASIVRPALLQSRLATRAFSSKASTSFPSVLKPASSQYAIRNAFTKESMAGPMRVAAFHASAKRDILPNPPQVIHGTANDAAPVPPPNATHGSYHWTFERLIAASLIPLTITPFAAGTLNPTMDAILCGTILLHSYIGFQAVVIDYLPGWRVPRLRIAAWWLLRAVTVMVGVGLYEFETNDVGVTEAIKRIWKA